MANFERLENGTVKFDITVEAEAFENAISEAYRATAKRYNIPGFRKGKAPRKIIESAYGKSVFYEEAFERIYFPEYAKAVNEAGVMPVDEPQISIEQIGEGQDLRFTATVPVKPEIVLSPDMYKGIEVVSKEYTVSDDAVDQKINKEREELARFVSVERPVQNGDFVKLDYKGRVGDTYFEGGEATNQTLEIGSGSFIPGFEEQLIGLETGTETEITVSFPEVYHSEDLAGKDAIFEIKINDIEAKELPELDDELAKDVSEFDTLEEFKEHIRSELQQEADAKSLADRENNAIDAVAAKVDVAIPDSMIEREIDDLIVRWQNRMRQYGIPMEDYLKAMNKTMDDIRDEYRAIALNNVKAQLALSAIVDAENLEVSEEELDAEIEKVSVETGRPVDDIKKAGSRMIEAINDRVLTRKAVACIVDTAKFVEPPKAEVKAETEQDSANADEKSES